MSFDVEGYTLIAPTAQGVAWAEAARAVALDRAADPALRAQNLRHGQTWFVGVDVLPNGPEGRVNGVAPEPRWRTVAPDLPLHRAQVSIIYPGYPGRDAQDSDAAFRFRARRAAAHMDGLLPIGADRRRFALEHHAYIVGMPLNACAAAPTVLWPGSHRIMGAALRKALSGKDITQTDITDIYQAARRKVFETCAPIPMQVAPGGAFVLHRHALHGTAPWGAVPPVQEGRMIAFFRPNLPNPQEWLKED